MRTSMPGLYATAEGYYGGFADYRAKTAIVGRKIPVFNLTPRSSPTGS
jgi:hypothetical protein